MGKKDNIFLVGLMGAGKTTVGKLLARQLGKTFIDSDHEIEARTGVKIPVIFEIEGEAGFRKREEAVIAELSSRSDIVLGTGGGAVLSARNREVLQSRGTVVYLRGSAEQLHERTRPCCKPGTRSPSCANSMPSAIRFTVKSPIWWPIPGVRAWPASPVSSRTSSNY